VWVWGVCERACVHCLWWGGWWVVLNDFFGLHVQTILHYKILELYAVCVRVQYLLSLVSGLWWDGLGVKLIAFVLVWCA